MESDDEPTNEIKENSEETLKTLSEDHKLRKANSFDVVYPDKTPEEVPIDQSTTPTDEFNEKNRTGLLKMLTNVVGLEVSNIAVPVTVNEPTSFLMRLCEQTQYSELLDKAALSDDSLERLTYISTFAISCYTVAERTGKPFNPLLGETFEFVLEERDNLRFISEQVSHHPPIGACHCETNLWKFWQSQCLKSKFTGNSLDCSVVGSNNVLIKATGEHFKWEAVKTCVHNIIIGTIWIDHYGDLIITNKKSGEKATINFKPCGWFSKGWHEITGEVYDAQGNICLSLVGKWNEHIYAKAVSKYAERIKDEKEEDTPPRTESPSNARSKKDAQKQKKAKKKAEQELKKERRNLRKQMRKKLLAEEPIWTHTIKPVPMEKLGCKFLTNWTDHTLVVSALPDSMKAILPPTDSRLRPDRYALEKGDTKTAAAEKHILEEKQREERKKKRETRC